MIISRLMRMFNNRNKQSQEIIDIENHNIKNEVNLNELLSILDNKLEQNSEELYINYNKYVEQPEIGFYARNNDF